MPTAYWIVILSIVFLSGIVKGTTGFGFALFSLPLLVHFIPIKTLVPIITLFNLFSSAQIIMQSHRLKINRSILLLSISGILGVICGSLVLKFLPDRWLKLLAASVLIVLSIMFLTGYRFKIRKMRRGNAVAGLISGFFGGSTSVSGPPLALFLTSLKLDTSRFRFTFAWYSIITATVAMFDYIKIGVVHASTFKIFLISLPVVIVSIELGKYISTKISQRLFYTGSIIVTLLAGLLMLYTCLAECLK
jgi:uncharacterized membrane protein YfcA